MTAIPQRRKGITYGKTSRRVYPNDEFLRPRVTHVDWKGPQDVCSREGTPAKRHGSDAEPDVYEFDVLSEDEIAVNQSLPIRATANKRRKMSSNPQKFINPSNLDVQQLRNVATAKTATNSSEAKGSSHTTPRQVRVSPVADISVRDQWADSAVSILVDNSKRGHVSPTSRSDDVKSASPSSKYQDKTPQRNVKAATPVSTPERRHAHRSLPVTPPSSGNQTFGPCVTPRQKDMWESLLTPKRLGESPGNMNLSNMQITTAGKLHRQHRRSPSPARPDRQREPTRQRRLIDLLNPGARRTLSTSTGTSTRMESLDDNWKSIFDEHDVLSAAPDTSPATNKALESSVGAQESRSPHSGRTAPLLTNPSVNATRGAKVTYAQHRSYLSEHAVALDAELEARFPSVAQPQVSSAHEAARVPTRHETTDDFELPHDDDPQVGVMRSVRELRNAGGNARLVSELELLLDEMHGNTGSPIILRNTLLRLVSRLQEPLTTRLFADKGLDLRFLNFTSSHVDAVDSVNSALKAMVILQLLTCSQSPLLLSHIKEQFVEAFLVELLSSATDLKQVALSREANMSKGARQNFRILCDTSLKSITGQPARPSYLSSRFLGLQCLRLVAEWRKDNGASSLCFDVSHIRQLILTSIPDKYDVDMPKADKSFSLGLAIYIIEAAAIGSPDLKHILLEAKVFHRIIGILPLLSSGEQDLRALTIELYINLTQAFPEICVGFAELKVLSSLLDQVVTYFHSLNIDASLDRQSGFNHAILSLMCLINITQNTEVARERLAARSEDTRDRSFFHTLVEIFKANSLRVAEVSLNLWCSCSTVR